LERYIYDRFRNKAGMFSFSCDQDILEIRRKM
jgi:hypothetical protein